MKNLDESKKYNKKKIIVISIILVAVLIIGVTIAYFMSRQTSDEHTITSGNLSITYTNENTFNLTDMVPLSEEEVKEKASRVDFTVTNNGDMKAYVQIDIVNIELTKLKDYDFKWALYNEDTKLTTGTFMSELNGQISIITGQRLNVGESRNYSIYVWINETPEDQTSLMGGTFKGKVQVTGYAKQKLLSNVLLGDNNKNVIDINSSIRDFDGLYGSSNNNNEIVYFYSGNVENNYLQLGIYNEDVTNRIYNGSNYNDQIVAKEGDFILWRIVGINNDGSIKLVSQNNISTPTEWNGEDMGSDYSGSNIEMLLLDWINNNNLYDYLIESNFCSSINYDYFTCPDDSSSSNIVGLLTYKDFSNALMGDAFNNDTNFWTMTIDSNSDIYYYDASSNTLNSGSPYTSYAAPRPVVNLKSNVTISSGTGTITDPYIIDIE